MLRSHPSLLVKYLLRLLILAVLITGLCSSLLVVFYTFPVEADSSDTAMLWLGFHHYGWRFFSSWLYTTDNWLLSLVPIHFLFFWLFGWQPLVVLVTGWGIFIASLFVTGLIAKSQHAAKTAIFLPLILLFAGHLAHALGYLTYSISHNITNLYGLICLLLTLHWLRKPQWILLIGIFMTGLISGVSDPWMLGAYLYPMLMTSFLFFIVYRSLPIKRNFFWLFVALFLAIVGSKSRCFELLHFLPIYHYQSEAPHLLQNAIGIIENLGRLFNIVPWPSLLITSLISGSIFIALLIYSALAIFQPTLKKTPLSLQYFFSTVFFSIIAILTALLFGHAVADKESRFMLNIFYLGPLVIALAFEKNSQLHSSKIAKSTMCGITLLFLLSSIISNLNAWKRHSLILQDDKVMQFISFLQQHQLHYGYGPYWGSSANAVTWLSEQKIQIIPVKFSTRTGEIMTGSRYQTSTYWQLPKTQQPFFVYVKNDHEECVNLKVCTQGIQQQFGVPNNVLPYQDGWVYIWN